MVSSPTRISRNSAYRGRINGPVSFSATVRALFPLRRITETPPRPGEVASAKIKSMTTSSGVHRVEKFVICLCLLQLRNQKLDRVRRSHRIQDTTQQIGFLQISCFHQKFFFSGSGLKDIHCREDPFVSDFPVKYDLAVTRALELLEDHFIQIGSASCRGCA